MQNIIDEQLEKGFGSFNKTDFLTRIMLCVKTPILESKQKNNMLSSLAIIKRFN